MSEWMSENTPVIPKPDPDPAPQTVAAVDNTQATGLRNFLKGEVIILDDDSDENGGNDKLIEVPFVPVSKQIANMPSSQDTPRKLPRDVEMVHPSRLEQLDMTALDPMTTPGPSTPVSTRDRNGSTHDIQVPVFGRIDQIAKSPPRAPKAMTSQGGNLQTPPTGPKAQIIARGVNTMPLGIKSPPTGPKAKTTPRKSSKGANAASAGSPAKGGSKNKSKRKKYIATRIKLGGGSGSSSVRKNSRPSNPLPGLQSLPSRAQLREHIPAVERSNPTGRQMSSRKPLPPANSSRLTSNGKRGARESSIMQRRGSELDYTSANASNLPRKVGYDTKYPDQLPAASRSTPTRAYRPQFPGADRVPLRRPSASTGSEPPERKMFNQSMSNHGVPTGPRIPEGSSLAMISGADTSLGQDYNRNLPSRPLPGAKRTYSPPLANYNPSKRAQAWTSESTTGYREGDVVGGKASETPATNKGRIMFERMGYKPAASLGKAGNKGSELVVARMKNGKGGLGRNRRPIPEESEESENEAPVKGEIPTARGMSHRDGAIVARDAPPIEEQNKGRLMRKLGYRDGETSKVARSGGISDPVKAVFRRGRREIGASSGLMYMPPSMGEGGMKTPVDEVEQQGSGTTERVIIIIDSDDEERDEEQLLGKATGMGKGEEEQEQEEEEEEREGGEEEEEEEEEHDQEQVDQEMQEQQEQQEIQGRQGLLEPQDAEMKDETQVITIDDDFRGDIGGNVEGGDEDVEMGETYDIVIDRLRGGCAGADKTSPQHHLHNLKPSAQEQPRKERGKEGGGNQESGLSRKPNIKEQRWNLPSYQHSSGRPTAPMYLFDFVIIERLEQIALSHIFHSIKALEEEKDLSHRVTGAAFNYMLVRSYLRVRDMFMHDPLRDVDEETCEEIAKGELDALLAQQEVGEGEEGRGGDDGLKGWRALHANFDVGICPNLI